MASRRPTLRRTSTAAASCRLSVGRAKGIAVFAAGAVGAAALVADEFYNIGSGDQKNLNAIQAFTHSTDDQMKTLEDRLYSMSPEVCPDGANGR